MFLSFLFFEDVLLVEFTYLVFTLMPGGVTIGNSGLCCCVLCLSSAIISLHLLSVGMNSVTDVAKKNCLAKNNLCNCCALTSKPMTMMSFSVVEYFAPQLEVKAMRKALDTTPQKLTNSKIWNHMPAGTAQRNRIYADQQMPVMLNYLTFSVNEVFLVPTLEFLIPSLEFLVPMFGIS